MILLPAIDLLGGKAVRLFKGDYDKATVFSDNPVKIALDFEKCGAQYIHIVDLDGAKSGKVSNRKIVKQIIDSTSLFTEIGGGIRDIETVDDYISLGIDRVILGTAAVKDEIFLKTAVEKYKEKVAVGVDINNGFVSIKGWTENTEIDCMDFCYKLQEIGVKTIIVTDISKDGAMSGTNHNLYQELNEKLKIDIIASGGVSSLDDIRRLKALGVNGAIIGKAYYIGVIKLDKALEAAQ